MQPQSEHPHGLSDGAFDALFTKHRPVIFAFHAYPWLIHRLTYRRNNHENIAITDDPRLVEPYRDEFDRLWELFAPRR